jgi:RNA binding exosome subunit
VRGKAPTATADASHSCTSSVVNWRTHSTEDDEVVANCLFTLMNDRKVNAEHTDMEFHVSDWMEVVTNDLDFHSHTSNLI